MGIAIALAAIATGYYWYSVWRHPYRPCRRCGGSEKHRDTQWKGAFGRCGHCQDGRRVRWGTRILTPGAYRAIRAGQKGRNY